MLIDGGRKIITNNSSAALNMAEIVYQVSTRAVMTAAIVVNAYLGKHSHMEVVVRDLRARTQLL